MKRVLLITGQGGDAQGWGDLKVTEGMRAALSQGELSAEIAFVAGRREFLQAIERKNYDIVWSALYFLSERSDVIGASGEDTLWVADELDARAIPYIGPSSLTMKRLIHKHETHRILRQAGVPVPAHHLVAPGGALPDLSFPAFVKPESESRSLGISDNSVVHTPGELAAQVGYVHATFGQAALVEEFLPGAEYTVLMLGNGELQELLPGIVQVEPARFGKYRILRSDLRGVGLTRLSIPTAKAEEARDLARSATDALKCWDHVRVDMRVDASDRLRIIEVNGIPGLKPIQSWSPQIYSLYHPSPEGPGREYADLLRLILRSAWRRHGLD